MYRRAISTKISNFSFPSSDKSKERHKLFNKLSAIHGTEEIIQSGVIEDDFINSSIQKIHAFVTDNPEIVGREVCEVDGDLRSIEVYDDGLNVSIGLQTRDKRNDIAGRLSTV